MADHKETFAFAPAVRHTIKLKIGIQGPSGAGKTMGALALATALAPNGKVAVIDTERGSAALYSDRFTFDTLELLPPYESERYIRALAAAYNAGYEVVVIDSISHQWAGDGGVLSRKEREDQRPGSNSYTNWAKYTKEHEWFKAKLLNAPLHLICTLRTKMDYVLETNEKGKQQPRKVGHAPIQRDGIEYEFAINFELQMDHLAAVSKDRTGLFDGKLTDLTDSETARTLLDWLASGKPLKEPAASDGRPIDPGPGLTADPIDPGAEDDEDAEDALDGAEREAHEAAASTVHAGGVNGDDYQDDSDLDKPRDPDGADE